MSEKPHTVAIGAFIVGAMVILVSALLYIGGSGIGRDRQKVVMVFDGSVKGLTIGAPVALRGVQIGQVTDIDLIFDVDSVDLIMQVEAEITRENVQRRGKSDADFTEEMIARGLRAQLNSQSLLTGLLYIQLDFHPGSELVLVPLESPYIQIPTVPTDLQRLQRQFEAVDFDQLTSDLEAIVEGLRSFTASEEFHGLPARLDETLLSMRRLSDQLGEQLASSGPRLDVALDSASSTLQNTESRLAEIMDQVSDSLEGLDRAVSSAQSAAQGASNLLADDSPTTYELNQALRELALAGRALQSLAKALEEQPESLIRGKQPKE